MVTPKGPRAASLAQVTHRARPARSAASRRLRAQKRAPRGSLLESEAVEREWSAILAAVRAGMLAVPSRCAARLPHLSTSDVAEIDAEAKAVLAEIGAS